MIEPGLIPQFLGNLEQLEKDISGLQSAASGIQMSGMNIHSRFQAMGAYYKAPEAGQLLATTQPVMDTADEFSADLEQVATALSVYAAEVRPLAKKLDQLKLDAAAFVDSVKGDKDWTDDEGKSNEHQALMDGVAETVAAIQAAERRCADKINAISPSMCRPKWTVDDGSHESNMYGYDAGTLKDAGKLPWGSPEERTYEPWTLDWAGNGLKDFGKGFFIDGLGGAADGVYTLFGGHDADKAGEAWGHLWDAVGGLGQYLATPYTALMDWTLGEPEDTSDEDRQKQAFRDMGKSLVAWDMWHENPTRASGTTAFNAITFFATPIKIGAAGRAGAGAKVVAGAAKVGEYLDPLTAGAKVVGSSIKAVPTISEVTTRFGAAFKAPTAEIPHSVLEAPDGSKVRIEDGQFIPSDRDGSLNSDPAPREPSATDRASSPAEPPNRELADVGAHSPEAHARGGDSAANGNAGSESPGTARQHPEPAGPARGDHAGASRDQSLIGGGEHGRGHGGAAGGEGRPSGGQQPGDGPGGDDGARPDSSGSGSSLPERANEPLPELTPQERADHWGHLEEVEGRSPEDFDHLQHDPDHNWKISDSSKDEARVGLDLRDQGRLPADIRRPSEADGGEFYSETTGKHYDIKGVHSDWPPFNNARDKSRPFKGAYNPAKNEKWVAKLTEQIVEKRRIVVVDTRNANQAAIDDVKAIIAKHGWEDDVIWYP
ncbi:hypothetical protein ACFQVC_21670 [Streptomyces monticola]|uniref:Tox-REase-5 domain-containing protein n=1 Tax=Streptomyces monticola TaxID=2666263 RepID=A0ABW2JN11_9ACTN